MCVLFFTFESLLILRRKRWVKTDASVLSGLKARASKNKDAHKHRWLSRWMRRRNRCGCKAEGKQPYATAAYQAQHRQVVLRPPPAGLHPDILTSISASAVHSHLPVLKPDHPDVNTHSDRYLLVEPVGGMWDVFKP